MSDETFIKSFREQHLLNEGWFRVNGHQWLVPVDFPLTAYEAMNPGPYDLDEAWTLNEKSTGLARLMVNRRN
jgi:hypothetical protein